MFPNKKIVKMVTFVLVAALLCNLFSFSYADSVNKPFESFLEDATYEFEIKEPRIQLDASYADFESGDDTALMFDFILAWVDLYIYEITEENTEEAFSRAKMIFNSAQNGVAFNVMITGTDSKTNHINILFGVQESEKSDFEIIWMDYDITTAQFRGFSRPMSPEFGMTMMQLMISPIARQYPDTKWKSFGGVNVGNLPDIMTDCLNTALGMGK